MRQLLAAVLTQLPADLAYLRIEHAAARVVVIPQAGDGVAVAVRQAARLPPLKIRRDGAALVVDGGLARAGQGGWFDWFDRSGCRTPPAGLPLITVRAPMTVRIAASGALFGEVAASDDLALAATGCGTWRLAPVRRTLAIAVTGATRVDAAHTDGTLRITLEGPGAVAVEAGHSPTAAIDLRGSGTVDHRGTVGTLAASLRGSGKVRVREVWGLVDAMVDGTGDVFYSRPKTGHFCGGMQNAC